MSARAAAAALALLALAASARAGEPLRYRFTPGTPLKYRTVLLSEGAFTLPDGAPRTMKLEAVSTVQLTPKAATPKGFEIAAETLRARTLMDGREVPPPGPVESKRTLTVAPTGAVEGAPDATFAVVFPSTPLQRGDTFSEVRAAGPDGLPVKTTYTVADTQANLPGYSAPVVVLEARCALGAVPKERKVALKDGGGKVWFDANAGLLVKTSLAYTFTEDAPGPDAPARRTTIRYSSDLIK